MIGYVTLGTNNLPKAAVFYDALLGELGARRLWEFDRGIAWGTAPDEPSLAIMTPFDGQPATVGNGVMVGLQVSARALVDKIHAKALELGGSDEGPTGPRSEGFYVGYFRDPEGNKLCAYCAN